MSDTKRRCYRCDSRGFVYKSGGGYSKSDMGGEKVDCPLCAGDGWIASKDDAVKIVSDSVDSAPDAIAKVAKGAKATRKTKAISSKDIHVKGVSL